MGALTKRTKSRAKRLERDSRNTFLENKRLA